MIYIAAVAAVLFGFFLWEVVLYLTRDERGGLWVTPCPKCGEKRLRGSIEYPGKIWCEACSERAGNTVYVLEAVTRPVGARKT